MSSHLPPLPDGASQQRRRRSRLSGKIKQVLKSDRVRNAICWLAARYIAMVYATGRWTVVGRDYPQALWSADKPFILSFWHGRLLMMSQAWPRQKSMHMLVSQHRDGLLIARTVAHFGIKSAAGSSSRGGAGALRILLKA